MIALVDKETAEEGYEFVYLGEGDECLNCSLKIPCHHNLEKGRKYRVTEAKGIYHKCRLFREVEVCLVEEIGIDIAIKSGTAFEGASLTLRPIQCKNKLCEYSNNCLPEGVKEGNKGSIIKVKGRIKCNEKGDLTIVTIRRI